MTKNRELTIIQLNDTHSYLELHQELFWTGEGAEYKKAGGFGRIKTIVNNIQKENKEKVLLLDGGDTIHGTFQAVNSRGESMIGILNQMGFDAMTAHWEFAYGPEHFIKFSQRLNYPMLAINCYDKKTDELVFPPYTIKDTGGVKVGIIGIAATIVDKVMPASFSKGVYFTLGNEELPGYIDELYDKGVDLIVVLSHLGFPQEIKLAREVEGIDILLSAHTHNRLYKPAVINETIIIQSGCHGSFVGRLDLMVEHDKIVDFDHQLVCVNEKIEANPEIRDQIQRIMSPYRDKLTQTVGFTETPLNRNRVLESTMDNFLLQSLIDLTGAELAFSNGWRYGAPVLPGKITENDLWNIIPVNPPVSEVKLTGDELWSMMEENLERTFSRDPYCQMGGYVKRCLGLKLFFKIENPKGQRIQRLFVQGKPVKLDKQYKAAFVTSQGVPEKYGSSRNALDIKAVDNLKRYLKKHKSVKSELRGTIVPV